MKHAASLSFVLLLSAAVCANELGELREKHDQRLQQLADKCDELTRKGDVDLTREAETTRNWHVRRDPGRQYIFMPGNSAAPRGTSQIVKYWHDEFLKRRAAYAGDLFEHARSSHAAGRSAEAYQLLHEVLREDPNHAAASKMLGRSDTASIRLRRGTRSVDYLGWRARSYWRVETPHFEIVTNVSRGDDARAMGRRLEDLYAVWRQVFFDYWSGSARPAFDFEAQTAPRLAGRRKHQVVVFADRHQYVVRTGALGLNTGTSEGFYSDSRKLSLFYARDELGMASWYHETTHQLFQETGNAVDKVGAQDHMWIIEGIAIYMESLLPRDGYLTLGGFDAPRMQYARYRRLNGQYYVPLAELTKLDRAALAKHDDIRRLYTQSGGLAHFLMNYNSGRYRGAAVDLVKSVYADRQRPDTLASLTGKSFAELDEQYVEFLAITDDDLARFRGLSERVTKLSLGHTAVTDDGLKHLANCKNLEWLDLEGTAVTDAGLAQLNNALKLERLNLKHTAIGDASLPWVGRCRQLRDLDLAHTKLTDGGIRHLTRLNELTAIWLEGTAVTDESLDAISRLEKLEFLDLAATHITDESLRQVARLKNLRALYLSHTAVTDAGLEPLKSLKNLELLQVDGTKVTPAGVIRLKESLPDGETRIVLDVGR